MEVARAGEVLTDELRADHRFTAPDQTSAGLVREERPGRRGQHKGKDHTTENSQQHDAQNRRVGDGGFTDTAVMRRMILAGPAPALLRQWAAIGGDVPETRCLSETYGLPALARGGGAVACSDDFRPASALFRSSRARRNGASG